MFMRFTLSLFLSLALTISFTAESFAVAGGDFISVADLKAMMDKKDPNLVLFGVLHNKKRYVPFDNAGKPIQGSYTMWRPDYSGKGSTEASSPDITGYRKSKEQMEELLAKAAIKPDSVIVVYSADAMHDAARVYWQLKLLGQRQVKILDGGVNAWIAAGYDKGESIDIADGKHKLAYKSLSYDVAKFDKTVEEVLAAVDNPNEWVIIDTRSKGENAGEETGSSKGAWGTGGIKNAVHIEWKQALNKDHTLKSKEELEAIYGPVIKGKKVITFCQSGVRSAHTYVVLKEILGAKDVFNYDGSWLELSYLASEASKGKVDEKLRENVQKHLTNWKDNKSPL